MADVRHFTPRDELLDELRRERRAGASRALMLAGYAFGALFFLCTLFALLFQPKE